MENAYRVTLPHGKYTETVNHEMEYREHNGEGHRNIHPSSILMGG
jgi:hypothetical protein